MGEGRTLSLSFSRVDDIPLQRLDLRDHHVAFHSLHPCSYLPQAGLNPDRVLVAALDQPLRSLLTSFHPPPVLARKTAHSAYPCFKFIISYSWFTQKSINHCIGASRRE